MAFVTVKKDRLYIQGNFPPKKGNGPWKTQAITLQLANTPVNQKRAEKILKTLEKQLKNGTFSWLDWGVTTKNTYSWSRAINELYEKRVKRGRTSEKTWTISYYGLLKQLPATAAVTTQSIAAAIEKYEPVQYSYKHMYYMMKDIAMLGGVPFPLVKPPVRKQKTKTSDDVPSDAEIETWILKAMELDYPQAWHWGMCATYGLRPHETERCKFIADNFVQISDETKTGFRTVMPLHEHWVQLFQLKTNVQQMPESVRSDPRPDALSQWLYKAKLRLGIKWSNYSLRHAYAGRLWKLGGSELNIDSAARVMGHSVREHVKTYRSHLDPIQVSRDVKEAIRRNQDRQNEC